MAVYTHVSAEEVQTLLLRYDAGELVALKGIAEGVENSNYMLETNRGKYFLTLYEKRTDPADLPYFHDMLAHLHRAGCKVPRFIEDRDGQWLQQIAGRNGCLIEFLSGVSVSHPEPVQAEAVGRSLGQLHNALADFTPTRPNPLGLTEWQSLFDRCDRTQSEALMPGLSERLSDEFEFLRANWPEHLPISAIHADLFPDNVLLLQGHVSGLIDFYFACSEIRAYDLAVTHAAWSFSADGAQYHPEIGEALVKGYTSAHPISDAEILALPVLARGACTRFLLTRLFDWIHTDANAVVTRKDPLAFLRRLEFYREAGPDIWAAGLETGHGV